MTEKLGRRGFFKRMGLGAIAVGALPLMPGTAKELPIIAVQEPIRSDIVVFNSGLTWVDAEYDYQLAAVLRPIYPIKEK